MTVSLNSRQYAILAEKRDQFDRAKFHNVFESISHEWKQRFAVVFGELFGATAHALNYQCNTCLLAALKQFQPLMLEYEARQLTETQSVADTAGSVSLSVEQEQSLARIQDEERIQQEQIQQIIQNQNIADAPKNTESRYERIAERSRNRHRCK